MKFAYDKGTIITTIGTRTFMYPQVMMEGYEAGSFLCYQFSDGEWKHIKDVDSYESAKEWTEATKEKIWVDACHPSVGVGNEIEKITEYLGGEGELENINPSFVSALQAALFDIQLSMRKKLSRKDTV